MHKATERVQSSAQPEHLKAHVLHGAHGAVSQLCHLRCLAMSQLAAPCYRAACTMCSCLCARI